MFGTKSSLQRSFVQPSWCEARRLLAALQPDTAESVAGELVVQASDVVDRRQAAPHT